jgi:hypothetical protein
MARPKRKVALQRELILLQEKKQKLIEKIQKAHREGRLVCLVCQRCQRCSAPSSVHAYRKEDVAKATCHPPLPLGKHVHKI